MKQIFDTAKILHQQGQFSRAEVLYRQILRQIPHQPDTLSALGMLLFQTGKTQEAIAFFRKAIQASPQLPYLYLNLAEAYRQQRNFDEAMRVLRKALKIQPNYMEAVFCLASLAHDQGKLDEAIAGYRRVIQVSPDFVPALNSLGVALQEVGQLEESVNILGQSLAHQPHQPESNLNLANTLLKLKRYTEAENYYSKCVALDVGNAPAHMGIAQCRLLDSTVSAQNDAIIESHLNKAAGQLSETPEFLGALATFKARRGLWAESYELLRRSLHIRPDAGCAYLYADSNKFVSEDAWFTEILERLEKRVGIMQKEDVALVHFAKGKMLHDLQRYDEAFAAYQTANDLISLQVDYDSHQVERLVERLCSVFSPDTFAELIRRHDPVGGKLVFILGMPRSGTTLVEQIVSSHPEVLGGGEMSGLVGVEMQITRLAGGNLDYPEAVKALQAATFPEMAESYLSELGRVYPGNYHRITDKLPNNFWRIGLIAILFPDAKIIEVKREAMDCCLSNFFQKFTNDMDFAYNLENLGHYYKQYEKIMDYWKSVLPGWICRVNYEDLISDPEYWSRKLIEYIGLEWDDACLAPHKLERTVKTASHWQVRQPIYKTSVQRWRNYEAHLTPLKKALGYQE